MPWESAVEQTDFVSVAELGDAILPRRGTDGRGVKEPKERNRLRFFPTLIMALLNAFTWVDLLRRCMVYVRLVLILGMIRVILGYRDTKRR